MLSTIVAMAESGVIGKQGGLPWHLPAELAHFKALTMGHPIIMGRRTHESIGRALPGRANIVISRDKTNRSGGCEFVGSLDEAIEVAESKEGADEIFIIGGEQIYQQAMPRLDKIYLTRVKAKIDGDKFFKYNPDDWRQVSVEQHHSDQNNPYDYEFSVLKRKRV